MKLHIPGLGEAVLIQACFESNRKRQLGIRLKGRAYFVPITNDTISIFKSKYIID